MQICAQHGKALANYANPNVKVLVVCNPTNTCALITAKYAAHVIPVQNITALTRLDHNRAVHQLAARHGVSAGQVTGVFVWGNHSFTQFADASIASVDGHTVPFDGHDMSFIDTVRQRGGAVVAVRNNTATLSAAKGAADHMHDWWNGM